MNCKKLWIPTRWMALLFLFCGSCEKSAVENQNNVLAIKTQAQGTHLSLTDAITLERPETGPFLGRVRTITLLDDYIIIVDESVRVFDKEGSYKWSISSRGDGESQYKIPGEPVVIPNTGQILIYDGGTGQTLRFSIKGEFLGQLKLPERRFINRMVVSEDHNLIHTYVDKNKNGMLCVTPLDTGEDIARFKVSEAKYSNLFFGLKRSQGLAYDETRKIIYFALPWEEKVMRIDLAAQEFLTPITINHPKFINLKLNEGDERKNIIELSQNNFSRLSGMYLLSSGDILLRYMFEDSSMSTALILLSDLDVEPSAQELKNKLRYNVFTSHGKSIYAYSSSADGGDTNGRIRVYRLINPHESPAD